MLKAFIGQFTRDVVSGWALDTDRPNAALSVSVYVDGQHVADTLAEISRPDLAKLVGFGQGRHGLRFRFPVPLAVDRPHVICLYCTETGDPLPGGERLLSADPSSARSTHAQPMTPILITGPGRTGTTLLMSLLANSPKIVAAQLVPFETRHLAYFAAAQRILTHPADLSRSTHPDRLRGDGFHIGFNPYHSPEYEAAFKTPALARDHALSYVPLRLDQAFGEIITEYYRRLTIDTGKLDACYFAEKNDNANRDVRNFSRRAFGAIREVVTVRDPRDVFCSYMAYFRGVDTEKVFHDLSFACKTVLAIHAEKPADVFFCHYEKLLRSDSVFLNELGSFLDTVLTPCPEHKRASMFQRHGTSPSPMATMERWRTDLPNNVLARCNEAWLPFLRTFGYAS